MAAPHSNLLVVDDDLDIREILEDVLASQGHHVRIARDGRDGLRMLHEQLPDAVVLDVEMPHLTGPDLVYRMIVIDSGMQSVPIVLVSGVVDLPEVARRVGTPYFLAKPFDLDDLLGVVTRALEEKRPPLPAMTSD